jgi:hypothetical protein
MVQSRNRCALPFTIFHFPFLLLLLFPATASADLTAFLGVSPTPERRQVAGIAGGAGMLIVGFEVEYANTTEDAAVEAPGVKTFMANGLVQTLPLGRMQFYGTAGAGVYRETLGDESETNVGSTSAVASRCRCSARYGCDSITRCSRCAEPAAREAAAFLRGVESEVLTREAGGRQQAAK